MNRQLTFSTALLLTIPPLLWAGNAVVGRMIADLAPPITLNFLRWALALLLLLPLGYTIFRQGSGLWTHWRRFAVLGLLGVGLYNGLQYLALQTSSPINVTLVGASMPVWMMLIGRLFFNAPVARMQVLGAMMSMTGVLFVLSRGEWQQLLTLRLVAGDVFMVLATIVWSLYSWLLTRTTDPAQIRASWAAFLLAQITFGLAWCSVFAAGEWMITAPQIQWGWPLTAAVLFIAIGPSIIAFRCWGAGVHRAGPNIAGLFSNLTPLFAALLSLVFLGETPHLYHVAAFALIVAGIVLSSRR